MAPKKTKQRNNPTRDSSRANASAKSAKRQGASAKRPKGKASHALRCGKAIRGTKRMSAAQRKRARRSIALKTLACVVVLGLCLALALVVGNQDYQATAIGWTPFIACAAAILGAFFYLQVLRRGLVMYEKTNLGSCERGRDVKFTVRFRNSTPLFFFRIEAYFFVADLYGATVSEAMTTIALSPFEKYDMDFTTRFDHIGTYAAGLDRVVLTDYLRLFTVTLAGPHRSNVQVTPRLIPIERIEFSNEATLETTKALKTTFSDSLDYAGVRDYSPGDPLKTIHWKLSARTDHYFTRLYEAYTNPGVAVLLDFYGPGKTTHELMSMFDCVVETAFSVAQYAREQGMETEIHFCDRRGERVRIASWRKSDLPKIVSEMPRFSNDPKMQIGALDLVRQQAMSQYGQNNLAVCTANIGSEMISAVIDAKMRHRDPIVFAVAPHGLEGRDKDRWAAPLARLDEAGIGYVVLTRAEDLKGVRA